MATIKFGIELQMLVVALIDRARFVAEVTIGDVTAPAGFRLEFPAESVVWESTGDPGNVTRAVWEIPAADTATPYRGHGREGVAGR